MNDDVERRAALTRQSDDQLAHARDKASQGLVGEAGRAAYEAGYCALMAALSLHEVRQFPDHPSAKAAELAAVRRNLGKEEQQLAVEGAANFYAASLEFFADYDLFSWAVSVRKSMGLKP